MITKHCLENEHNECVSNVCECPHHLRNGNLVQLEGQETVYMSNTSEIKMDNQRYYQMILPIHPGHVAQYFLITYSYWFTHRDNDFYNQFRAASEILDVWVKTGQFPKVKGYWIHFQNRFEEWTQLLWKEVNLPDSIK